MDTWSLSEWQARLHATPYCAWLGLVLESCGDDGVLMRLRTRPEILGSPSTGALHGGVVSSLVDTATSYAVMVRTQRSVATVDMRVDFHRPALAGEYRIEGTAVRIGRTVATADARVFDSGGALIASGRAVMVHTDR